MGSILLLHTLPTANMLGIIMWYGVYGVGVLFRGFAYLMILFGVRVS